MGVAADGPRVLVVAVVRAGMDEICTGTRQARRGGSGSQRMVSSPTNSSRGAAVCPPVNASGLFASSTVDGPRLGDGSGLVNVRCWAVQGPSGREVTPRMCANRLLTCRGNWSDDGWRKR
jgi:hypothetical protein